MATRRILPLFSCIIAPSYRAPAPSDSVCQFTTTPQGFVTCLSVNREIPGRRTSMIVREEPIFVRLRGFAPALSQSTAYGIRGHATAAMLWPSGRESRSYVCLLVLGPSETLLELYAHQSLDTCPWKISPPAGIKSSSGLSRRRFAPLHVPVPIERHAGDPVYRQPALRTRRSSPRTFKSRTKTAPEKHQRHRTFSQCVVMSSAVCRSFRRLVSAKLLVA
ncbi:hypothetical protein LXA43DRAFT_703460 [Ganoderma leucocontextum]|nr:hypothetical protein LXA43DRAFT_703460 [Ganoderma leucocontextum]